LAEYIRELLKLSAC